MVDLEVKTMAMSNPELRRQLEEHEELNRQVDALNRRRVRTPQEEMERTRLSKQKLASKDRIAGMVARLRKNVG
ncbi:MAG: YdcH family protein [Candidatus Lernaella stagnicola]|nr:YdcH family protein [Candidatus Lernaella stagnicola]